MQTVRDIMVGTTVLKIGLNYTLSGLEDY